MEKRALVAIALSVAVLLAWQLWIGGPPPSTERPKVPEPTASSAPEVEPGAVPRTGLDATAVAEVITPLYRASFAADGTVTAWNVEYRGAKRLVVGGPLRPLAVAVRRPGQPAELVGLRPATARTEVTASTPVGRLTFGGATADGIRVRR